MKSWDPEVVAWRRAKVVELSREGKSASEIAARLGITNRSVTRHRKAAGITKGCLAHPMPQEARDWAGQLFDDGCSIAEVARTIGYATSTVRKHFPGRGWTQEQFCDYIATVRRCNIQFDKHAGVFVK